MNPKILVLVADDYEDVAELTAEVLKLEGGFSTVAVQDGTAAVAMALAQRPHVCLLDIDMPGLTGIEAARAISDALGPERPLLMAMTGKSGLSVVAGTFDCVFQKPIDIPAVARAISERTDRSRLRNR